MAKERVINTKFWDDPYIINLDPIEKLLFLYFLTNPLTNISGIYELSLRRISFDTGIDKDMILKIVDRFKENKKICYADGWIIILNFIKNQKTNPSVIEGIKREIDGLPDKLKNLIQTATDSDSLLHSVLLNLTKLNLTKLNLEQKDARVRILIDFYHDLFYEKFGTKAVISGSKDGALLKKALEIHSEDTLKKLMTVFFESKEDWIKNSGYSIGVFYSQINKLITKDKIMGTNDQLESLIKQGKILS